MSRATSSALKLTFAIGRVGEASHHVLEAQPIHARFLVHMRQPRDRRARRSKKIIDGDEVVFGFRGAGPAEFPIRHFAPIG